MNSFPQNFVTFASRLEEVFSVCYTVAVMSSLAQNITVDDQAGCTGVSLEECSPLQWPGPSAVDEAYVRQMISRLLSAAHRPPHLLSSFALSSATLLKILRHAAFILSQEPNVVDVITPHEGCTHIFGDFHGDIFSLVKALNQSGLPSDMNVIVFSGDYVDRGPWGVEVLLTVLLLKIWQPKNVHILRGNHETTGCVTRYGFSEEVKYKYSSKSLPLFINIFRQMPLVAVVRIIPSDAGNGDIKTDLSQKPHKKERKRTSSRNTRGNNESRHQFPWSSTLKLGERRIVVMHGGLFRAEQARKDGRNDIAKLTELMEISRCDDDPNGNAIEDVLWSDPQASHKGVSANVLRGAGVLFGETSVDFFFRENYLHGMIRAHEGPDMRERRADMRSMCDGYSIDFDLSSGYVATVFSASNYLGKGNKGSFATLFGKGHKDFGMMPIFTTYERLSPPSEIHYFYTPEADPCCTPRRSLS